MEGTGKVGQEKASHYAGKARDTAGQVCDTLAGKAEETKVKAGESKDTASHRAGELTGTAQQEAGETGRARQEKASHYASKAGETGGQGVVRA